MEQSPDAVHCDTGRGAHDVAVVGSPTTTTKVTLNLLRTAYRAPIHGKMVAFTIDVTDEDGSHAELALGTITQVETFNPAHTPRAVEGQHIAELGRIDGTGDRGDTRGVEVGIEAVFRRTDGASSLLGEQVWRPAGATLSNSPATGTPVRLLDQQQVDHLMSGVEGQRWLGHLRGSTVLVPYTQRDFATSRGAVHDAVVGVTGAGKTAATAYMMSCDLAHESLGQIVFDPQAQWASEHGIPISPQGLAAATGRKVTVARLSRSLRLRKDAPMFIDLLGHTSLFTELAFGAGSDAQTTNARRVWEDALDDRKAIEAATGTADWTEATPDALLTYLLETLRDQLPTGTIYAGTEGQQRVAYAIAKPTPDELEADGRDPGLANRFRDGILDQRPSDTAGAAAGGKRWRKAIAMFTPVHNLWSQWTPEGQEKLLAGTPPDDIPAMMRRKKAWPLLMEVFDHDTTRPAPWLILDLSADDVPDGDDTTDAVANVLDAAPVKARIMRQLLGDLKRTGTSAYKAGSPLNVRVTFDEAWQYAMQPDGTTDPSVAALSDDIEDGCRDLRKLGVGLRFILQTPTGLRESIWKQLNARAVGYGLTEQSDLRRLENIVGNEHLGLYLATAGPEATGRYPFMMVGGGITGLSFGTRPVFLDIFTDPDEWLSANRDWVTTARRQWRHLLPEGDSGGTLASMPERPTLPGELEEHIDRKARHSAGANQKAANRLTTAIRGKQPFGMAAPPARPDGSAADDPPPF